MINHHIFREYDIRGTVDRDLNPQVVKQLGMGIGTLLRRAGGKRAVVGRDNRFSSPDYRDALTAGLLATGTDVIDLGMVPTPLVYFALHTVETDDGKRNPGAGNPLGGAAQYAHGL